ncbi:MAG: TIGR02710 family CRISPR-associated CARF protein [Cyanobium sp. CZS 25K]|nr:TIGR02710 family CRISPR-associated CARF protein [Cyanobium sp. CZS25K]
MSEILVLSLGTSPEPIVQCITRLRPRRVVFVCSEGTRSLVDDVRRQVRIEAFDPDRDVEVLASNDIDQLHSVYCRCRDLLQRVRREMPAARISVDYTGGTKTMATGLGLAAIDDGRVILTLTTIERRKPGESAITGNSIPIPVQSGAIQFRRFFTDGLQPLLQRHNYAAAQAAVAIQLQLHHDEAATSSLRRLDGLLLAFDAWDRWDLDHAESLLRDHASDSVVRDSFLFPLQRVIQSRNLLTSAGSPRLQRSIHGFEAVEDLLLNAARRACQERYDDAVGRLYRSLELTAQLLLLIDHGGIRTGDLQLELLPDALRAAWEEKRNRDKNRIELALTFSFDLLADLGDPVGEEWRSRRSEFIDALQVRNQSLLAHGFRPVTYADWQRLDGVLGGFLRTLLGLRRGDLAPLRQLPVTLAELGLNDATSSS